MSAAGEPKRGRVISGWRKLSHPKPGFMKLRRPAPSPAKVDAPVPNTVSDKAAKDRWDAEGGQPVAVPAK